MQLECNTVANSEYSRRETIELNPVSADIILNFTPCKAEQPLQGMNLQEKEAQKH